MFLSRSKFDVSIFTDIDMPFSQGENVFCVLEYAQSQLNKTVQHAFVKGLSKQQCRFGHGTYNSMRKVVCAGEKDLDNQKHQKRWLSMFAIISCKSQRNRYKEQVWKPRFHQQQFGAS